MKKRVFFIFVTYLLMLSSVSAQEYSLDITIDKQIYSAGENVTYKAVLLKDSEPFGSIVKIKISDISGTKLFDYSVDSNKDQNFFIEKEFPSGYWGIESSFNGKSVKRFFSIGEREEAEFSLVGDKLIIKNIGNVQYTRKVEILIGDKVITQQQDIEVNQIKEIRLVAPDGVYNIQVADGIKTISKQDVYLAGTGRVVGALDEQLVDNQPILGGARNPSEESFFSSKNFSVAFIFIGAIFGLFILVLVEKRMRKKRTSIAKDLVEVH